RPSAREIAGAAAAAGDADVVVLATADALANAEQARLYDALRAVRPTAVVTLRGPYDLIAFPDAPAYLCVYHGREAGLVAAAEVLNGTRRPAGSLPVEIPALHPLGAGMRDFG
ncbi:MAG: glycoside hydrolase family 3 protein, partial [Candidatus Limnocylindria bacterium]